MSQPIVVIIGRQNVGKSTLFNRILGYRDAIVHDMPGVTRDRHYAEVEWAGKTFTLVDTGGFILKTSDAIERAIREQTQMAIDEADVVILLVDVIEGITPTDRDLAEILRKSNKKVFLTVNKVDNETREFDSSEFFQLGLGKPITVSALQGRNVGDFLDVLIKDFKNNGSVAVKEERVQLAVIGRPNVGKSSFVNALLGKPRTIVTEIPGTTRDSIDSVLNCNGEEFLLIDTAGLRRKIRVKESIEFFSTLRALKSIERCDVAITLADAMEGIGRQDLRIIQTAAKRKKGIVLAVNKWDLVEKDKVTEQEYEQAIKRHLRMFDYIPLVFISAKTKQNVFKVIDLVKKVFEEKRKRIPTSELNKVLLPEIKIHPPSSSTGKEIKLKYITQLKSSPPVFVFFVNEPTLIQNTYKRFLENKIREHFGFLGVPLILAFRKKSTR